MNARVGPAPAPTSWPARRAWALGLAAAAVFAAGVAVYALDRGPGGAVLWPGAWARHGGAPVFGAVGGVLPAFAHTFAFSVWTALCLAPARRTVAWACAGWALLDGLFEAGQHAAVSAVVAPAMPGFVAGYLRRGTFDIGDLVAGVAGAMVAWALLRRAAAA